MPAAPEIFIKPNTDHRIRGLDALRGIAALAVVLFHYTYGYESVVQRHNATLFFTASYGYLGVNLFFIISGFVILRSLEHCQGTRDFVLSRFARLYPAFVAASCVTIFVRFGLGFNPRNLGLHDVILSFATMGASHAVDPSFWSLTYEIIFYALAALALLILRVRNIEIACLLWLACAVCGLILPHSTFGAVLLAIGRWSFLFVIGMMIYLICERRSTALTVFTALTALAMSYYLPGLPGLISRPESVCITTIFALCIWAAGEGLLQFLCILPIMVLGEISYSLYLVHQIAGYEIIQRLEAIGVNANIAILAAVCAAIIAAIVLRKSVEVPAQRKIKQFGRSILRLPNDVKNFGYHEAVIIDNAD